MGTEYAKRAEIVNYVIVLRGALTTRMLFGVRDILSKTSFLITNTFLCALYVTSCQCLCGVSCVQLCTL